MMTDEDKRLLIDTLAEMRELKGELHEFKLHVMGRVQRLEKKENEQTRNLFSVLSLLISSVALAVTVIINFLKSGGN
jgi:hypothetical protein